MDALVSPFPRELTTPPVTKMCLGTVGKWGVGNEGMGNEVRSVEFGVRSDRQDGVRP
jgi:hypothetical protein